MENNSFNRIYSMNLAAFIMYCTGELIPKIEKDEDNGYYYFIFDESKAVSDAINQYKDYSKDLECRNLREYLRIFKELKKEIKNLKITDGKTL